jgi:hypothetical protein
MCDDSWTLDHYHRAVLNTFLRRLERDKPSLAAEEARAGSHDGLSIGRQLLDKGSAKKGSGSSSADSLLPCGTQHCYNDFTASTN